MRVAAVMSFMGLIFLMLIDEGCKSKKDTAIVSDSTHRDVFSDNVRVTDFQAPEQERVDFKLPPGFEVTLFASEPDISKPINMEFDDQGRLWVTNTTEYPYPAAEGKGHDKITILEDTNGDGKADKFTPFANNLNIPIGITPFEGGAIAYSIPNIYRFIDADSDGISEDRKVLLGPFGYKDTHGMQNNFIRGFDGWIYACHGFTNTSTIAGADGDSITMISGNTYRFLPDGSRVEQTSFGRVNPFGNAFDEWGYLYSLDCHTKPIYQLIRGAEYPSFGKKAPALGFAPEMMSYEFGSTANSGMVFYDGLAFPEEYRNNFYSGNVVTGRINRNTMTLHGSSPKSKDEPDFLISSDPWFRPVDIKIGPDGSMYIADFYNKIIGHYEVPLEHPGRDRKSGRIWKISYKGPKQHQTYSPVNWSKLSLAELIKALNFPQLNVRLNIANRIVDVYKNKAIGPVLEMMQSEKQDSKTFIQGLWILHRLKALPQNLLEKALTNTDPMIQVHALRVLSETKNINEKLYGRVLEVINNTNPQVQRVATEVLGHFPKPDNISPLINVFDKTSDDDMHLKYTILVSIREHLKDKDVMQGVAHLKWNDKQMNVLMKVMPDVPSKDAASFAFNYLQNHPISTEQLVLYLGYIGRYLPVNLLGGAISLIEKRVPDNLDIQYTLYQTMRKGLAQSGTRVSSEIEHWALSLAQRALKDESGQSNNWVNIPIEQTTKQVNPWSVINKPVAKDISAFKLLYSEYKGASPISILHSTSFKVPASLQMNVYDKDFQSEGFKAGWSKNVVRIRLNESHKIVAEYRAEYKNENSMKELVRAAKFDLSAYKGQNAYIEIVDSTRTGSIGIGMLTPAVVNVPDKGPAEIADLQIQASEIVADYKAVSLEPMLGELVLNKEADYNARSAAAAALMTLSTQRNTPLLESVFNRLDESPALRARIAESLGESRSLAIFPVLEKGLKNAPRNLQVAIVNVLVSSGPGIDHLINAVKAGTVIMDVLSELAVKERLTTNIQPKQQQQLDQLTSGNSETENRTQVIQARLASFDPASVTTQAGQAIFIQNCSMCHQINGNGGLIGPQLDGIGNWGQKALTQKILDPNSNISKAFLTYNITLENGKKLNGLYRREEGSVLIFANPGGEEFSVSKNDIKEKKASKYTLMPDHFSKTIAKKDFDALLKFLLSTKG